MALVVKNLPASARDAGSVPGLGRPLEKEMTNPLQYSCLENPMDRGAWQATVHGKNTQKNYTQKILITWITMTHTPRVRYPGE